MLSKEEYIIYSLENNLFFARLMKEHLIFIESGFSIKDSKYMLEVDNLKMDYENFLLNIIPLANKNISSEIISSNELFTSYTLKSEILTQLYTGICIDTNITKMEKSLIENYHLTIVRSLQIHKINTDAISLVERTIDFKSITD